MASKQSFADFFVSPPGSWGGVITVLATGTIGSLVTDLIPITTNWHRILSIIFLLIILVGVYLLISRSRPQVLVPENQQPASYRGLILLIGTGRPGEKPRDQSADEAIAYHMTSRNGACLQAVWLIATTGTEGSLPVAEEIKKDCKAKGIKAFIQSVSDPFGIQETYDAVQLIYSQELKKVNLTDADVIADFTGSVKPMSAGMILACGDHRAMQYMYGRKKGVASVPRLVKFSPRRPRS